MLYKEKSFVAKDGREAILRSPRISDAEEFTDYIINRAEETDYMLRDPDACGSSEETAA